jgi:hypothetical protein
VSETVGRCIGLISGIPCTQNTRRLHRDAVEFALIKPTPETRRERAVYCLSVETAAGSGEREQRINEHQTQEKDRPVSDVKTKEPTRGRTAQENVVLIFE